MSDRNLGCKTVALFGLLVVIIGFFAFLLNFTAGLARTAHGPAGIPVPALRPTDLPATPRPELVSSAEIDASNMDRLPALMSAARGYAKAHNGLLPPMDSPAAFHSAVFPRYTDRPDIFFSLRTGTPYLPNPGLSGRPLAVAAEAGLVVFYEPLPISGPSAQGSRAVMFANGMLRSLLPASWKRAPTVFPLSAPVTKR